MRAFDAMRQRSRRDVRRRPRIETMEDRVVLSVAFDSVAAIGGAQQDFATRVAVDTNGDVYATGSFTGTVDFDRAHDLTYDTLTSQAAPDGAPSSMYVAKYAGYSGELLWVRSFLADAGYGGTGIATSGAAAVYIAGTFSGAADFDPTGSYADGRDLRTAAGDSDSFVLKLDAANGGFTWAWNSGDSAGDTRTDLAVDDAGNVYAAGTSNVNYNPGQTVFVTKLNPAGAQVWSVAAQPSPKYTTKPYGNAKVTSGGIAVRGGSVLLGGEFQGQVDFDPGAGTTSLSSTGNAFVWKLTTAGTFTWVRAFSGGWGQDVVADAAGNIYATGSFGGTVDFDPGRGTYSLTSTQTEGTYVTKLDAGGNFVWARRTAGSGENQQLALDPTESRVLLVGGFGGTADFDPGPGAYYLTPADGTGTGKGDLYATSLTAGAGAFDWAVRMGGPGKENIANGDGLAVDASGRVLVAGSFELTADFGPYSLTGAGSHDGFLARLSPSVSALSVSGVVTRSPAAPIHQALTAAQARPVLSQALACWRAHGADTSRLGHIDLVIADLGGARLGEASGTTITLDDNAAGWGWNVGRGRMASGRMDLLSALAHEVGHLLGHGHHEGGVMAESLAPGVRRVPAIAEVGVVPSRVGARAASSHSGRLRTASRK